MSIRGKAYIAGAFEHPTRKAPDKTTAQLHAECARGALADAGLSPRDVDGYFCAGDAPGMGAVSMVDFLGLKLRHVDSTVTGGFKWATNDRRLPPLSHLVGLGLLLAAVPLALQHLVSALVLGALAVASLVVVAAWEAVALRRGVPAGRTAAGAGHV